MLSGKFKQMKKRLETQKFTIIKTKDFEKISLNQNNCVLVNPVKLDTIQKVRDIYVSMDTPPRLVGEVIESTVDEIEKDDFVIYNNSYIHYEYFFDLNNEKRMKIKIPKIDILMYMKKDKINKKKRNEYKKKEEKDDNSKKIITV